MLGTNVNSSANSNTKSNWDDKTEWVVSGGTANYKTYDYATYYKKDNNTIVYVKPTAGVTYAAISGLKKDATFTTGGFESITNGTISLGSDQLGTSKVTLKITPVTIANAAKAGVASLQAENGNSTATNFKLDLADGVTESTVKDAVWDTNGTTAKLTGTLTKGYRLSTDKMSITYQAADKDDQVIVTVSGLKSGGEILKQNVASISGGDPRVQIITLGKDQLGTTNVTSKGEGYKLAIDSISSASSVVSANRKDLWEDQTEWVVSGTTATYKTYDKLYYSINDAGTQITYNKAADVSAKTKTGEHATHVVISGLRSSIASSLLGSPSISDSYSTKTGDKRTSIIFNENSLAISLGADALSTTNNSKATLTDKDGQGYTLVLGNGVTASSVTGATMAITGTTSKTAKITGTQGAGYFLSNDSQTVTYYSAAKTNQTIAQVTGLKSTASLASGQSLKSGNNSTYDAATNTFTLAKADLNDKVTISGTAKFSFASDYTQGSITGSSAADYISVAGGNNTINAAGGNDVIDLSGSNNVLVYATGNGNDVVTGFTAGTDVIKITNVAYDTTKKNNITFTTQRNDVIVKVGTSTGSTIRLKNMASSLNNITVKDKNNATIKGDNTYTAASSNVLADDNYEMTPQLSDLVNNKFTSYSADDSSLTQDVTSLTKQSAIAYSGKK